MSVSSPESIFGHAQKHEWTLAYADFKTGSSYQLFNEFFYLNASLEASYAEKDFHPTDSGVILTGLFNNRSTPLGILCTGLVTFPLRGCQQT